jgi:hypothetical protein
MRRAATVLVLTALFLSGCATEERPEGVVDRWLNSLNQGAAGEPGRYAEAPVSEAVLPGWRECSPGALDVIEVGRGEQAATRGVVTDQAVPFRVEYSASIDDLCPTWSGGRDGVRASAFLVLGSEGWQVVAIGEGDDLPLPSEGGERVASASAVAWSISLAVAAVLCLLVMLLMATAGRHETIAEEVVGEDIGHQHGGPA